MSNTMGSKPALKSKLQIFCLELIKANPGKTSRELAKIGNVDKSTPSRRLPELERAGFIYRGDIRACSISNRPAAEWFVVKQKSKKESVMKKKDVNKIKKKPVTYLLREIDRDFWAKVKSKASLDQITVKQLIMEAIEEKVRKK